MSSRVDLGGSPTGPLSGVRIADFTAVYSGPLASTILADQGAEVIKVEPANGDLMRRGLPKVNGMASAYLTLNRNKRSLCIDLRTPEGQDIARRLIGSADVVMENFRPGVMDRLGLGYQRFKDSQPKLVYVSINGVGPTGPYANRRVYDAVIQAISGFATLKPNEPPQLVNSLVCDKVTSLTAAEAVVAALFRAERSGQGQKVELSMLDSNLFFLWSDVMANFTFLDDSAEKMPYADLSLFIRQTADGWVASMPVQQAEVLGALRALGLEALIDDPRFSSFEERAKHRSEFKAITDTAYASFTTDEICQRLEANDVPYSRVNLRHEVESDPQIQAMEALWSFDHPTVGEVQQPRPPAQFASTPSNIRRHTARLGEHNREILAELDIDSHRVDELMDAGVVYAEEPPDTSDLGDTS